MCGITGYYSERYKDNPIVIDKMMASIKHRGPDGEGSFRYGSTVLGHVRLSIIDIDNGAQPMHSSDGRYTIIYNGEIYNYLEIRQSLVARGYKLRTYSDTEVLLTAYIEFGKEVLNMLNGMFAFVIHDRNEDSLFCARDHFGIKPFYYWSKDNEFAFASEIKALKHFPSVKFEANQVGIFDYLTFQLSMGDETMFQDIYELPPAHYMKIVDGKVVESKEYWKIKYDINENLNQEEFSDRLLVLLENSLSIQVRSDVPVGAYLSGGIDSSTVSILAAKNYFGQLKTFTGGFHEDIIYDETQYAKIVSNSIHSDLHFTFPTAQDFSDSIEKLVYHMDYPGGGPGLFPQYMVSKLAAEHVKVVLGGQGGDEVFGGYTRYAVAYLEQCLKGAIFETQDEGKHIVTLSSIIENLPSLRKYVPMIKAQFSSGLFDSMDRRYYNIVDRSPNLGKLYTANLIEERNSELLFERFSSIFNSPDSLSYFNKMTYFDMKTLLPTLLQIEDRVSMAVSLESRVPLLDKRIVELAASMPPTMKFAGGKTKHMLINTVKNILPKEIVNRKDKMGFPVPLNDWLKGPLKSFVMDIFTSQAAKERSIYNLDHILHVIENQGSFNRDIWGALNLEIWYRQFID